MAVDIEELRMHEANEIIKHYQYEIADRKMLLSVYGLISLAMLGTWLMSLVTAHIPNLLYSGTHIEWSISFIFIVISLELYSMGMGANIKYAGSVLVIMALLNGFLNTSICYSIFLVKNFGISFLISGLTFGIMALYGYMSQIDILEFKNIIISLAVGILLDLFIGLIVGSSPREMIIRYLVPLIYLSTMVYESGEIRRDARRYIETPLEFKKYVFNYAIRQYIFPLYLMYKFMPQRESVTDMFKKSPFH